MKKFMIKSLLVLSAVFCLSACNQAPQSGATLKVGTITGPETTLMEVAKQVAKKEYDLNIQIIEFGDYAMPNVALNDGSIDANVFQHQPYLDQTIRARHFDLVTIGKTFIYPMGLYSKKIKDISAIPEGATVAVPNDPTNEARALLLLQKAGLIQLTTTDVSGDTPLTIADIRYNPKKLQITPLKAAQLPRALEDVDLAAINTNYAVSANLLPNRDALFVEDRDSDYANIIVVKAANKTDPRFEQLVAALHSAAVQQEAEKLFANQAIPAW